MRFIRFSFIWELLFLFLFALGVDQIFFNGDRFSEVQLHPFFFIVILISIQYGTNKGLIAAILSTFVLLAGNIPKQSISQDQFEFLFHISYRPMLWIALAVLLGGFRDKYFRNLQVAETKFALMEKQSLEFCKAYKLLDKERNRLEINLTSQPSSVHLFHKIALIARNLDPREIFNNLLDITDALIKPEKCSWYYLKNSKLKLVSQKRWDEEDNYLESFSSSSCLYQEVIDYKRFLSVTVPKDAPFLLEQGVLASPLYDKSTGKVYGMIKIENMGFLGLNLTSIETFKVLCEWLGTLLETSIRYQQSQNRAFPNPENHSMPMEYFKVISDFLLQLSNRVNFECHTIDLSPSEKTPLTPDNQLRMQKILRETFRQGARKTDLIFENSKIKSGYLVLLPNTSLEEAQIVSNKLENILAFELGTQGSGKAFNIAIDPLEKLKVEQRR